MAVTHMVKVVVQYLRNNARQRCWNYRSL